MVEYPDTVRIGHMDYSLTFKADGMGSDHVGECRHLSQEIVVLDDVKPQYKANTVVHEILHGCFYSAGLNSSFNTTAEEEVVNAMANQICMVIRNNPELIKVLSKELK